MINDGIPDVPMPSEVEKQTYWRSHNRVLYCVNGSWTMRSRYLMERHLHRKLRRDEVVHHINGIKTDDRIENLSIVSRSEHQFMHFKDNKYGKIRRGSRPSISHLLFEGGYVFIKSVTRKSGSISQYAYHIIWKNGKQIWTYLGKADDCNIGIEELQNKVREMLSRDAPREQGEKIQEVVSEEKVEDEDEKKR